MRSFFSESRVRQLSVGWSLLIVVGLFVSDAVRVLPSIGVAGLFATGLSYGVAQRRIAQRARWPELLSFTLVYALHLTTGLWRGHLTEPALWQDLLLELPFVLLPVAFLLLPTWLPAHKSTVWLVLLGCCLVAATSATANYLRHVQAIDHLYLESRFMPTEPDHIRFSLLVSMAVLAGTVLLFRTGLPRWLRPVVLVGVLLLFLFQHLLAARSGLVTLYAAGALWLGWLGWQLGRWRAMLLTGVLVASLAGASLLLFTTLQNKIINTRVDAGKFASADAANNFSVTGRVYSYQVAGAVIREHPVLGVSKLRLADAMAEQYAYMFPAIERDHYLLPHNQFLFNLAAYGAVGLLLFLVGFYYPLLAALRRRNILTLLMYVIVSVSFLVEYTLETNIGVLTGLFFILLATAPEVPAPVAPRPAVGQ